MAKLRLPSGPELVGDVWGGAAAMLVALPSAIAFGVTSYGALGPEYVAYGALAGVLGTVALGLVAPVFGGARRLITAPCAPAAAVMSGLALALLAGKPGLRAPLPPEQVVVLMGLVALVSGALQMLYGLAGGGRLIKYIPFPVVSGYLSGVGVIIFLSQVPKLLGLPKNAHLWPGILSPDTWNWLGLAVGAVTILGMLFGPRVTKRLPAAILGLFAGLAAYACLALLRPELRHLEHNALLVGPVGATASATGGGAASFWRALETLHAQDLRVLVVSALMLSVLLSIDTLKTCVVMDALTRSRHNSNRELRGQGLANLAAGLLGGMPGAGTMGATLVNLNSGGRTRLSSFLEGVFALVAFLALSRLVGWVPVAALAGILIVIAFRMFDRSSFHLLRHRSTWLDFGVILAVVVVALSVNLIAASGAGLALAILLFIREQMRGSVIRRKVYGHQLFSKRCRLPAQKQALSERGQFTTICELQGSLFFGTTDRLLTELDADLKRARYLILDLRRVQSVDFTAAHLLEQIQAMLSERGARLVFSHLPASLPTGRDLALYFNQLGLVDRGRDVQVCHSLEDALEWTEDQVLAEAGLGDDGSEQPLELAEIDLLREFDRDHTLPALAACVMSRTAAAGEIIFRRGDAGDELYLVRRGAVRISLPLAEGRYLTLATFGRGTFFGDMAFLDPGERSADAVAVAATELFVLSRAAFNQRVYEHPLLGVKVFARLARMLAVRLREADGELRTLQEC